VEADEEGDRSEDAEAAVDDTPDGRDAADWAGDEGERDDGCTSDYAELEHPFVADGIAQRAEERYGEDKVGEGEPVGSVGKERIVEIGVEEGGVNPCNPQGDGVRKKGIGFEEGCQPGGFLLEREGGEAAEDQAKDEEGEPEADGPEQFGFGLAGRWHVWRNGSLLWCRECSGGNLVGEDVAKHLEYLGNTPYGSRLSGRFVDNLT
jgi:hypothetical protein